MNNEQIFKSNLKKIVITAYYCIIYINILPVPTFHPN